MPKDFEAEITELIADIIEVPVTELTPDADLFNELSVDSLKAIEIVAACEKKYRVIIPESEIPNIRNCRQIIEFIRNLKNSN